MIESQNIIEKTMHYTTLSMSAYRITIHLLNSPVNYDPSHLDSILSKCVVNEATNGNGLPISSEPYLIPLPLKIHWQSKDGLPLWESTDFIPCHEDKTYSLFWARRSIRPELVKKGKSGGFINIRGSEGADKEYLMPMPAHSCMTWRANFYGNVDEVARLLSENIGAIGKKRSMGHGVIKSWDIEPISEFSFFEQGKAIRNIPLSALDKSPLNINLNPIGWTPPYWLPTAWLPCLAHGETL